MPRFELLLGMGAILLAGCGGGGDDQWTARRPQVVPASGNVIYNDQPLEGATVAFIPVGDEKPAYGKTDSEGHFSLRTFEVDDGAVPGQYRVRITKWKPMAGLDRPIGEPLPEGETESLIPERYTDPAKSGLTAKVQTEKENTFTFDLKSGS